MRLLIAGGAGYIGSALIPRLLARGYMVDVVDLFWFGNYLPSEAGIVSKDLFDVTVEDLKDYDQVIFLAGLSNDPMAEFSPSKNFIYNAAAPAYLAYTAKKAGVKRYIYASSCSVSVRILGRSKLTKRSPAFSILRQVTTLSEKWEILLKMRSNKSSG